MIQEHEHVINPLKIMLINYFAAFDYSSRVFFYSYCILLLKFPLTLFKITVFFQYSMYFPRAKVTTGTVQNKLLKTMKVSVVAQTEVVVADK